MTDARRTVLEMRHITKRFPGHRGQRRRQLRPARRRGSRAARRERCRQVDPDEHPLRALPPGRGRDRDRAASAVQLGTPSAAIDAGVGMVHQHFMLIPVMTVAENIVLARGADARRGVPRSRRGQRARAGHLGAVRARRRPEGAHRGHHGGPAAAGRDPEGAVSECRHPRARRADGRADAAGGRRALRDHPRPHRAGQVDHLHQPQAQRGDRGGRPDHGAPPRQEDRDAARRRERPSRASRG